MALWQQSFDRTVGRRCRPMRPLLACYLATVVSAIVFGGCGGDRGPERVVVSGTVTYNGVPIPVGNIRFMPVATSPVPMAGAAITDGKYKIDIKGGVPVGTHKIEIEAYRDLPPPTSSQSALPAGWGTPREQYLPKRFNADSQTQITIEPGSRTITKNFELTD